ncbi:glycosyltransferase family 4 protein [Marinobacter daepoensis]|uniref:glycosyltransferase family 4 protein n=1 Tax=Marinobacter daepoensis TaxID=262077 RepID=UPI001C97F3AD|nr:glycosyltransferase family 4 protein [Marinobacter daepoensis]MBY6033633.1 glycosyltransferase family 4 protein [Marinobacter daepoensis]
MIHISNNFVSSSVHANLISALSAIVGEQTVIIPIRDPSHEGKNSEGLSNTIFYYHLFNNKVIRYFPFAKVFIISLSVYLILKKILCSRVSKNKLDVVAHNFWSDGMLAFLNSYVIPMRYVMVVRNTDINYFVSKLPHYRWLMKLAIKRSEGLVFVSKSHYLRFKSRWPGLLDSAKRVKVIPNAIPDWWLSNLIDKPLPRKPQACFVGNFVKNKNLGNLVEAGKTVRESVPEFKLLLVGGGEEEFLRLTRLETVPDFIELPGKLSKEALLDIYRSSRVFAMPSFTETFGLVYLEALSQGCSVICSLGEGIDGMWDEPFIRSVQPDDVKAIGSIMVELIHSNPDGIPTSWIGREISHFTWTRVADRYLEFFA